MAGKTEWQIQLESNVEQTLKEVKALQEKLNALKNGKYNISVGLDAKELETTIKNLTAMLAKGNGNSFKQFSEAEKAINKTTQAIHKQNKAMQEFVPSDKGFAEILKDLDLTQSKLQKIEKIAKRVRQNEKGEITSTSFVLTDDNGSTERYTRSKKGKDRFLGGNYIEYNAKKADSIRKQIEEMQSAISKTEANQSNLTSEAYRNAVTQVEKLNLALTNKERITTQDIATAKKAVDTYTQFANVGKMVSGNVHNLSDATKQFNAYLAQQGEVIQKGSFSSVKNGMSTATGLVRNAKGEILQFTGTYNGSMVSAANSTKTLKKELSGVPKFIEGVKSKSAELYTYWVAQLFNPTVITNWVREGVGVVKELDTARVEMRKVSDEPVSRLKAYQEQSFDTAQQIGTVALELQKSTADWMRLGESLDKAAESSRVSNVLLNVSEFENIDAATESLISMSQAYKDLEKIDIVDKLNNIGNKYSISTDGLATALKTSASALTTANNDMDKAVAIITAGNAIVQNPDSVGAGARTIALRLAGTEVAKKELESLGETVDDVLPTSKLRDKIRVATAVASNEFKGFDILNDNGNYKDTYEILQGIADIYQEIVKTDKELGKNNANLLLETIAGKNRSNIAASILQNPEMLRSVYQESKNSSGSAMEENAKYLDSIEAKLNNLRTSAQKFWQTFIDSDSVKGSIEFLTDALDLLTKIVDKSGSISAIITTYAVSRSLRGKGKCTRVCAFLLNVPFIPKITFQG